MFSSKTPFDKNLDKATSQLLFEPDWDATLQVCDSVRQQDVTAKYALTQVKKKLQDKNPRVGLYALQVLESCMKNCGNPIHEEVATGPFMNEMKDLVNELLQAWAHAFRNEAKLKIVVDTFNQMKSDGHSFPELKESDAMFVAEKAPDWVDGDRCFNCRTEFGVIQRKHHCRHCGQVFCSKCSSKESNIPKFGIERPVRVCDPCHGKLTGKGGSEGAPAGAAENDLPAEYLNSPLSQQPQVPQKKSEDELKEEEELQLALALSLDEAENKHIIKKEKGKGSTTTSAPSAPSSTYSAPQIYQKITIFPLSSVEFFFSPCFRARTGPRVGSLPESQLLGVQARRGARWNDTFCSGVPATAPPISHATNSEPIYAQSGQTQSEVQQNGDEDDDEQQFIRAMSGSIDVLVNRMRSDSSRGRSIASDTTVQGLFQTLHHMHPRLLKMMQEREEKRAQMEALQDKLAQIRDAREALDALREEHREKLKREAEEAERLRQIQMAQKLEVMRRKKQEMLQMQQQKALMRMQEQERERQIWLEQQRQQMQMRQTQYTFLPQGLPGQQQFPPEYGSPSHMHYGAQQGYPSGPQPGMEVPVGQPPSGYQPGMYQQPQQKPPGQGGMEGQYQPGQQPPPQGAFPPGQYQQQEGYTPLSSVDYQAGAPGQNPYSMQGMQAALPNQPPGMQQQQQQPPPPPQQTIPQSQQQQHHYQPTTTAPQYGVPPGQPQQVPGGAPIQQPPPMGYQQPNMGYQGGYGPPAGQMPPQGQIPIQGQMPQQGQVPPQQQQQVHDRPEETLISFD
ncbi:putative hepatocyte growth factor-regulated tyrosine kinase substrate [Apostichopus japonicus]|uniref:Hepatocyte growth factor-regulated tyrosine kinase substrate n=2 Tax=Stichopus japonicus TaxID=307972 RepID=A0A2G8KMJ7_STIJA|nr:putative hepatocyte growth factor-regulated tyrosine kinase substrate [Apostichopus japonicus]